jgi:hypothetical protein
MCVPCLKVDYRDRPSHESTRYLSQARGKLHVSIGYCMCNLGIWLRRFLKRHGWHAACVPTGNRLHMSCQYVDGTQCGCTVQMHVHTSLQRVVEYLATAKTSRSGIFVKPGWVGVWEILELVLRAHQRPRDVCSIVAVEETGGTDYALRAYHSFTSPHARYLPYYPVVLAQKSDDRIHARRFSASWFHIVCCKPS